MISIRTAQVTDAAAIARVHVDTWRTAYAGLLPAESLAGLSYDQREQRWQMILTESPHRHLTFVATTPQAEVIGFVGGGPEQSGELGCDGELYALYLRQEYHGQRLGKRLVRHLAQQMVDQGFRSLALWVLEDTPARGFYAALGGQQLTTKTEMFGETAVVEVAYVWPDLSHLL